MTVGAAAGSGWRAANPAGMGELVGPALDSGFHSGLALGRYRLGARLGAGGFGAVFAAHDERLDREVAVKVIPADGPAPERAQREAVAVARLDHPGIVALFDAGEDEGSRYLVSELVHGRTLAQLERDAELSDRDVVRVGLALADALAHAHERGVVHRDVKPQNVIVPDWPRSGRGAAKLTDFGVAQLAGDDPLTHTGDVVGTLAYMAPEQAAGERVDERADVYALGLVLYEALAGFHPVARGGSPVAVAKRLGKPLAPLRKARGDLPAGLGDAIDRAVRPDPGQRGDLDDLFDALADALPAVPDAGGTVARHPLERRLPALPPALGRLLAPTAAGALVLAALLGLTPAPGISPWLAGAGAAALVALLPRLGWLVAAGATVGLVALADAPRPAAAAVILAAVVAPPLALRTDGASWSLPAGAPVLGLAGLATAFPALAGRAPRASARAALGALGAWWLVLGEALLPGPALLLGAPSQTPPRADWEAAASLAAADVIAPLFATGTIALALLWAAGACALPWIVRGRSLAADFVGASAWAGGLAAGTGALGAWLGERVASPEPRGLALGAVAGAALALLRRPRTDGHTGPVEDSAHDADG